MSNDSSNRPVAWRSLKVFVGLPTGARSGVLGVVVMALVLGIVVLLLLVVDPLADLTVAVDILGPLALALPALGESAPTDTDIEMAVGIWC